MASRSERFAKSLAVGMPAETKAGFIEWITILLPIILGLPCFQPKTAAEKHQWIKENPERARKRLMPQMRDNQPERLRRVELRAKAQDAVNQVCAMSLSEFVKLHDEVL